MAWRIMVRDLHASGVLDRADGGTVEAAAVEWGRGRELRDALAEVARFAAEHAEAETDPIRRVLAKADLGHLLAQSARGSAVQPLLAEERRTWTTFRLLAENLGLSPSARAHLGMANLARATGPIERDIGAPPRLRVVGGDEE